MQGIERIVSGDQLLAIIVRSQATIEKKYNFLTDQQNPLQLGVSQYATGERIAAHVHLRTEITAPSGNEFILVKSGRLRVNLFDGATREKLAVEELGAGDMILLVSGGHGFEVLEACQIVEVKQGPYLSKEKDKVVWE